MKKVIKFPFTLSSSPHLQVLFQCQSKSQLQILLSLQLRAQAAAHGLQAGHGCTANVRENPECEHSPPCKISQNKAQL